MDNGYSLSDLRAATGDGNGFGGNGAWWIVILFLFCFMGGGFWGNRQGEFGQYATAASQQEILFGQQFGQLNDRITNVGSGICNLGYEMQGNVAQLGKEVALGQANLQLQASNNAANLSQQLANCCCTTQRAIDGVNANIDQKFAALEKSQLEQRIAQLEQANNQLYMAQQFTGVVRYPMNYAYSAGNSPFCGGCGCN